MPLNNCPNCCRFFIESFSNKDTKIHTGYVSFYKVDDCRPDEESVDDDNHLGDVPLILEVIDIIPSNTQSRYMY